MLCLLSKTLCNSGVPTKKLLLRILLTTAAISIVSCSFPTSFSFPKHIEPALKQQFDENTETNITSLTQPLIFYREHQWLSSNSRDYVYLGPIRISRAGQHDYLLWLGIWSTIDRLWLPYESVRENFQTVYLVTDGEPMELEVKAWSGTELGIKNTVYSTPVKSALNAFYIVSQEQIRELANAENIFVYLSANAPSSYGYKLWKEGSQSFAEFADSEPDE
ncbi:MAG TPA: hypothetical protein QF499_07145 [Gammaproteobacteria bacterium]|jgi:hypothetical protein|nr:hypothetical protein [Chromatiales bacterium]MCP4926109.1 hypothetical protein [Gammaproteobacteria bacterium]HJP38892.1 hypothetical protein [Gammaproteobacteria bacterium]